MAGAGLNGRFVRHRRQKGVDDIRRRIGIAAFRQVACEIGDVISRSEKREFVAFGMALTEPDGGEESVAKTHATGGFGFFAPLADEGLDRFAGTAVAEGAVLLCEGFAEIAEIADALAFLENLRLREGAFEAEDLERKSGW